MIEFLEHARARQRLQHAEAKACAADAAAGEAKRGAFRFQRVNPRIDRTEPRFFLCLGTRLRGGRANFASEFLFENVRERFRRFALMWPPQHECELPHLNVSVQAG